MSLRINTNITAMNAHRQLRLNDAAQASSIEKLSSGYRINSGADNPAGLALSENLKAQTNGLAQAINNANDAINLMKTADGALSEVQNLLQNIRDVAVHASNVGANDTLAAQADQTQISKDIEALNRIASQTAFGTKKLLDGSGAMGATVLDPTNVAGSQMATSGSSLVAGYADVTVTQAATKASHTYANAGLLATDTVANAGTITVNGTAVTVGATDTVQNVLDKINGQTATTGVTATLSGGSLKLDQGSYGSGNIIAYAESADVFNGGATNVSAGVDAQGTVTQGATVTTFNSGSGNVLKDAAGDSITLAGGGTLGAHASAMYVSGSALTFQVGANAGETVSTTITSAKTQDLGDAVNGYVANIDVTSFAGAQSAIKIVDSAISQISTERASIGAQQNGIQSTVNSLGIAQENISASVSTIKDTDMAAEMVKFTKTQILMQAST